MIRAHPRSRGENCCVRHAVCVASGSSPLTRGKRWGRGCRLRGRGLIPAHAGKTQCKSLIFCARSAHPRSRGENPVGAGPRRRGLGSSPLTRGKHLRWRGSQPGAALIPAHAGKTTTPTPAATYEPAHPRSRGENGRGGARMPVRWGSSPLTRGKPQRWSRWTKSGRAHPRSRGENGGRPASRTRRMGSSPLTRGKPRLRCPRRGQDGLIPAHAGKTNRHDYQLRRRQAHPRSRGENS